ncbi:glycosyltransferase [Actinacidiphila glaucinigra]|uniref:glycosyltransferase n=1 Tax=Actinacidiphila glaucinigra TaxID=235986 RepID=UPI002DD888E4|nr:glycosyltransferase [Actinacidiphila glaucinigra]
METLYRSHDLLLVPSQVEDAFPRVIVEAGLHGVATLGSDQGGIPEAVCDGGLILSPDDVQAWLGAINSPDRTRLGTTARAQALPLTRPCLPEFRRTDPDSQPLTARVGGLYLIEAIGPPVQQVFVLEEHLSESGILAVEVKLQLPEVGHPLPPQPRHRIGKVFLRQAHHRTVPGNKRCKALEVEDATDTELRKGRLEPVRGLELNFDTPLDAWHLAWAQQHGATRD